MLRCSPAYAAPEQLRGEPVSTGNDVFGLGALLYELLTGCRIRDGKTVTALLLGHAQVDQIIAPCQLSNSKLPGGSSGKDLNAICLQALAQDPQQRYASVTELQQDLRNRCSTIRSQLDRNAGQLPALLDASTCWRCMRSPSR